MDRKILAVMGLILIMAGASGCEKKTFQEEINGEWDWSVAGIPLGNGATIEMADGLGAITHHPSKDSEAYFYKVNVLSETETEMVLLILNDDNPSEISESGSDGNRLILRYVNSNHFKMKLGPDRDMVIDYRRRKN